MVQKNQESRCNYWATRWSIRSLVRLLRTARLTCSLCCALSFARSLTHSLSHSRARGKVNDSMAIFAVFFSVLNHLKMDGRGWLDAASSCLHPRYLWYRLCFHLVAFLCICFPSYLLFYPFSFSPFPFSFVFRSFILLIFSFFFYFPCPAAFPLLILWNFPCFFTRIQCLLTLSSLLLFQVCRRLSFSTASCL